MPSTIEIEVNELRLRGRHGVLPQEREVGNEFVFTVSICYPADAAVTSDDLSATLNYAEVVEVVREVNDTPSQLLEHLAGRVKEALLQRFPAIVGGRVRVEKIFPPIPARMKSVSVTLRW